MTIKEIQQEILRMKKEQDVCILAFPLPDVLLYGI